MQPLTFPCPRCDRRMGVGLELSGRSVRCPHCSEVVLAPTLPSPQRGELPASPGPAVSSPLAAETQESELFKNVAPREGADSILGDPEDSDDSVFSAYEMKRPLLPPPPPPAPSTVVNVVPRTPLMTPAPPPAAEDPFGQLGAAAQGKVAPIPPPSDAPAKSKPRAFDWKLVALIAMTGYAVLVTGLAAWGWLQTPAAHETTPAKKAK